MKLTHSIFQVVSHHVQLTPCRLISAAIFSLWRAYCVKMNPNRQNDSGILMPGSTTIKIHMNRCLHISTRLPKWLPVSLMVHSHTA